MKQNQKNRYNGRYNNRNSRLNITRNTSMESTGPCGKLHGTAMQLFEKYQAAAKDSLIQNDLVLAEICMQHADHYMRLQNIAIANEQVMRQSNNMNSAPIQKLADDELPVVVVPVTEESIPTTKLDKGKKDELDSNVAICADKMLAQMDLSVPVVEIQKKHTRKVSIERNQKSDFTQEISEDSCA